MEITKWAACATRLFYVKSELINMTGAWDKEKIWVPDRNRTHDLRHRAGALSTKQREFTIFIHLVDYFMMNGCTEAVR